MIWLIKFSRSILFIATVVNMEFIKILFFKTFRAILQSACWNCVRFCERKMAAVEDEGSQSENKNDDSNDKCEGKPFSTMYQVRKIANCLAFIVRGIVLWL